MKKVMKTTLAAILLIAFAMSLAACGNKDIYKSLADDGYTVKVRFDASGAFVNDTQNVTIVEVYNEEDAVTNSAGKTGVALLAPDDPLRKTTQFKLAKIDGTYNYFQVGWYRERTPIVDANGNALDVFGVPVSESKREPAYTYSGKWDFANDVVTSDDLTDGEMILYAAWAPYFTYEFYAKNESGEFEKIGSKQKLTLNIPKENERTGKLSMNDFPRVSGMTFEAAYLDEAMTQELTANLDGKSLYVDYEKGIATVNVIKIYTTWSVEQDG